MKRIKKFEGFNWRMPTRTTFSENRKRRDIHGTEKFTQKEMDFFDELANEYFGFGIDLEKSKYHTIWIDINIFDKIEITKLGDDWYTIYDYRYQFEGICDEWEEVIGYFMSRTEKLKKRKRTL
jgi:hypothetical protein